MEDKELQELFDAKRTTEANRRRQDELAAMIRHKARQTRPLWPVWITSAAAAIALLIVVMPSLFSGNKTVPIQVAQVDIPEASPSPMKKADATSQASAHPDGITKRPSAKASSEAADTMETLNATEDTKPERIIDTTPLPADTAPFVPAPRIMRRTSTMLACTDGCPEPADYKEPAKKHTHIEFFSSQQLAEATAYTITFNK